MSPSTPLDIKTLERKLNTGFSSKMNCLSRSTESFKNQGIFTLVINLLLRFQLVFVRKLCIAEHQIMFCSTRHFKKMLVNFDEKWDILAFQIILKAFYGLLRFIAYNCLWTLVKQHRATLASQRTLYSLKTQRSPFAGDSPPAASSISGRRQSL